MTATLTARLVGLVIFSIVLTVACSSKEIRKPTMQAPTRPPAIGAAVGQVANPTRVGGSSGDPCELVTHAEAEIAVGQPLDVTDRDPAGRACMYKNGGSGRNVNVKISRAISRAAARREFDAFRAVNGQNAQAIAGIGDAAVYIPWLNAITVLSGDIQVAIGIGREDSGGEELRPTLERLARGALSRLHGA